MAFLHGKSSQLQEEEEESQPLMHRRTQMPSDENEVLAINGVEAFSVYGEGGTRASSHMPELPHRTWLLVLAFLDHFGVGLILPLFGPMLKDLGASPFEQGLLTSTYGFLQMISSPFIGRLSDHKGRQFVMMLSFIGAAIGYTLIGTSQSILAYFVSRVIVGATKHSGNAQRAYVADHTSHADRAVELGRLATAMGLGIMTGPVFCGFLFRLAGYVLPVMVGVSLQLLCAVLVPLYLPERPVSNLGVGSAAQFETPSLEPHVVEGGDVWAYIPRLTVLKRANVPWLFVMRVVWGTASMAFQQGMTLLIVYKFKLGVEYNGLFLSYEGLLKAAARAFAVQPLVKLYQDGPLILRGLFVLSLTYFLSALSPTPAALCVLMAPVYMAAGVTGVTYISLLTTAVFSSEVGQVLGYYDMIMSACQVVGPTVAGALASRFDESAPGIFSSVLALIAAALFYFSGCSHPSVPLLSQKQSPMPPPSSDIENPPLRPSIHSRYASAGDASNGWEPQSQHKEDEQRTHMAEKIEKEQEMHPMPPISPTKHITNLRQTPPTPPRPPSPDFRIAPGRTFSRILATSDEDSDFELEFETKRSLASVFMEMAPHVSQKA